ncbi:MAG TPA: MATE family efflux transporter [bacterium]|nr:MATE family efflux transporter [bacterium]
MPQEEITSGSLLPAIIRLAVPLILANLMQTAYNIVDTYWVGRLGEEAVAAISMAFPVIFLIISFGAGLTIAGTVLIAQYTGRRDQEQVDLIAGQTIILLVNVSLVISAIGFFASGPLLKLIGAEPAVLSRGTVYLKILFAGASFMFMFFVFQSILRGWGDTKTPMWVMFWSVLANTILDPLLIMGIGPFPELGIAGAAWATVISRGSAAVVGMYILFSGRKILHVRLHHLWPEWSLQWRLIKLGIPASLEQTITSLGITVMMFIVADFGTTVLAAYGIGARILSFVIVPAFALSMATSTALGQNFGAGNIKRAEQAGWLGGGIGFLALAFFGGLFYIYADPIINIFIRGNPEVVSLGSDFLRMMAPAFGFLGVQIILNGGFRGAGKTGTAMVMAFISFWGTRIPLAYGFAVQLNMGADGIWLAFPISIVIVGCLTAFWFWLGRWKKQPPDKDTRIKEQILKETVVDEGVAD